MSHEKPRCAPTRLGAVTPSAAPARHQRGTSAAHHQTSVEDFLGNADSLVLGTTVVTNAMLEYSGANTGLITTKGFRDVLELRTGFKEDHFDIRLPATSARALT